MRAILLTLVVERIGVIVCWAYEDTWFNSGIKIEWCICTGCLALTGLRVRVLVTSRAVHHTFMRLSITEPQWIYGAYGCPGLGDVVCEEGDIRDIGYAVAVSIRGVAVVQGRAFSDTIIIISPCTIRAHTRTCASQCVLQQRRAVWFANIRRIAVVPGRAYLHASMGEYISISW